MSTEAYPVVLELILQKESFYTIISPHIIKDLNNNSTTVTFSGLGLFFHYTPLCGRGNSSDED